MAKMVGSYSIRNLIQSTEYLLEISRSLNDEIHNLEKSRDEVTNQQKEATKQGLLVKKMTSYMSDELERMESTNSKDKKNSSRTPEISKNIEKLSRTETKLRELRERLTDFIEGDDVESLKGADTSLSIELKQYESFLLTLTTSLNEKIASLEKIAERIKAEKRESEQQKLLLKEMVELFNGEIEDLEQTLKEIKE
jgi:DNA repair exonuclease SbcCD ATPase subunit